MRDLIHFANWAEMVALIAFLVSFSVFVFVLVAIAHLPASKLRRLEAFPLEKETIKSYEHESRG